MEAAGEPNVRMTLQDKKERGPLTQNKWFAISAS